MEVHETVGQAGGVGQQIADAHLALGRNAAVVIAVAGLEHFELLEGRNEGGDWGIELKDAPLVQAHEGDAGDGFGH